MLFKLGDISYSCRTACGNDLCQLFHLIFKPCRKNSQTHYLNKSDILLLDMMQLAVRVVNSERMLLGRDVISQHQIQLIAFIVSACNGGYCVVRLAVCFGKYKCRFICIASPCSEYLISKLHQPAGIIAAQTDNGHRPLYSAYGNIFEALYCIFLFNGSSRHGKGIVSALKMLMAENRTANNGKVGI